MKTKVVTFAALLLSIDLMTSFIPIPTAFFLMLLAWTAFTKRDFLIYNIITLPLLMRSLISYFYTMSKVRPIAITPREVIWLETTHEGQLVLFGSFAAVSIAAIYQLVTLIIALRFKKKITKRLVYMRGAKNLKQLLYG